MVATACVATLGCASPLSDDEARRVKDSPQFSAETQRFTNPPNPDAKPSAGGWAIWSRFVFGSKTGTVPVDAIPVAPVTRALPVKMWPATALSASGFSRVTPARCSSSP